MNEAQELIRTLSNPKISEFIDRRKLAKSQAIVEMVEFSARHAIEHGDRGHLERVLNIFRGTEFFAVLRKWFCSRIGLEEIDEHGVPVLRKSSSEPDKSVQFHDVIRDASIAVRKPRKSNARTTSKTSVTPSSKKKKLKKVDMLDSRARFPGSFEAGRKR